LPEPLLPTTSCTGSSARKERGPQGDNPKDRLLYFLNVYSYVEGFDIDPVSRYTKALQAYE
jgi:hypothetical protein